MYRKRLSLVILGLLLDLSLLSGCADPPRSPTVTPETIGMATPSSTGGCTDVKSVAFNMGASVGNNICVEGLVDTVTPSSSDDTVEIELATATAAHGIAQYKVLVIINDKTLFGEGNLAQIVKGTHVAATGLFSRSTISSYNIKVTSPDQLIILE